MKISHPVSDRRNNHYLIINKRFVFHTHIKVTWFDFLKISCFQSLKYDGRRALNALALRVGVQS